MISAPETFELARLRLRRPRLSDAEAIFRYGSDPEVAHYALWPLRKDMASLVESLRERQARWEQGTEFHWILTLPPADQAIGGVSCLVDQHSAEIGYLVDRRHWGRGYATEAAQAVVAWALRQPSIRRVWATCDAENAASVRVLEKLGFKREELLRRWAVRPNISNEPRDAFLYARIR